MSCNLVTQHEKKKKDQTSKGRSFNSHRSDPRLAPSAHSRECGPLAADAFGFTPQTGDCGRPALGEYSSKEGDRVETANVIVFSSSKCERTESEVVMTHNVFVGTHNPYCEVGFPSWKFGSSPRPERHSKVRKQDEGWKGAYISRDQVFAAKAN